MKKVYIEPVVVVYELKFEGICAMQSTGELGGGGNASERPGGAPPAESASRRNGWDDYENF